MGKWRHHPEAVAHVAAVLAAGHSSGSMAAVEHPAVMSRFVGGAIALLDETNRQLGIAEPEAEPVDAEAAPEPPVAQPEASEPAAVEPPAPEPPASEPEEAPAAARRVPRRAIAE